MSGSVSQEKCPKCGSADTFREEVDIGVGVQRGPMHCNACGFDEHAEVESLLITDALDGFDNAF